MHLLVIIIGALLLPLLYPLLNLLLLLLRHLSSLPRYLSLPRPHPLTKVPVFIRLGSDGGGIEEVLEEARDTSPEGGGRYLPVVYQGIAFGGKHMVGLTHPDDIKEVLSDPARYPKDSTYELISMVLGKGLVTTQGEEWKRDRRLFTPAFHFQFLRDLLPLVVQEAQLMAEGLREAKGEGEGGGEVDPWEFFGRATLNIMIRSSLGDDVDVASLSRLFQVTFRGLSDYFAWYLAFGGFAERLPFSSVRGYLRNKEELRAFIARELRRRSAEREKDKGKDKGEEGEGGRGRGKDFVSLMEGSHLGEEEMIDHAVTFFFAGHDTTSSTLAWCVYYLCRYPGYQARLQEELDAFGFDPSTITLEDLEGRGEAGGEGEASAPKLSLLKLVIKEVLRLRPPVIAISRDLNEDKEFSGHLIPKGTVLDLMIPCPQTDPRFWEAPDQFRPERFEEGGEREGEGGGGSHAFSYLPFSAGPRNCIGKRLAMLEAQVLLGTLLRNFSFHGNTDHVVIDGSVVSKPKGLRVSFVPRFKGSP